MENLEIYNATREVPKEAQKEITGGRLKGMTDIQPMWRIKTLTEQFGPCGIGWYYTIDKEWIEEGADGEKAAFVNISLYIKVDNEWSKPIPGNGGSMFVANEKNGLRTSDEAFKMAQTDAISVACKNLGFAANIYWNKDKTKYTAPTEEPAKNPGVESAELRTKVISYANRHKYTPGQITEICKKYKVANLNQLSTENCRDFIQLLAKKGNNIDE